MHSLVLHDKNDLRIIAEDESALKPGKGEVLVAVKKISLCGSDYGLFYGSYNGPCSYPIRFGHEWSGVVIEAGADVQMTPGNSVTGDCSVWCGNCTMCSIDKNLCEFIEKKGITQDGFSQQYVIAKEKYLYVDKNHLPEDILALSELFAVALRGVNRAKDSLLSLSSPALIIGGGSVGMALYLLLKYQFNLKYVEVYDRSPEKMSYLNAIFPSEIIRNNIPRHIHAQHDYRSINKVCKYHLVFEAAGTPEAFQTAVTLAMPRGTIVTMGMLQPGMYELAKIVLKALTVVGSIGGTGAFEEVLQFLADNQEVVSPLITSTYHYSAALKAFENGKNRVSDLKVQLTFQ